MTCYIYILRDPVSMKVRYVGKTNNVYRRNAQHCTGPGTAHLMQWRDLLRTKGLEPLMEIVKECDETNWHDHEARQIKIQRERGANLLNVQSGVRHRPAPEWMDLLLNGPLILPRPNDSCRFLIDAANGERYRVHGGPFSSGKYFYVYPFRDSGARFHLPKASIAYAVPCGFSALHREFHGAQVNMYLLQIEEKRALLPYRIKESRQAGELRFMRMP